MPIWTEATSELIHMAEDLIQQYHETLYEARIGFLFREEAPQSKGKAVLGKAQKVPDRLKPFLDYDFIIWIAEDEWSQMPTERRRALLDHQLMHCYMDPVSGPTIRNHDVEEFVDIIRRHGFWTYELLKIQEEARQQSQMKLPGMERAGKVEAINPKAVAGELA